MNFFSDKRAESSDGHHSRRTSHRPSSAGANRPSNTDNMKKRTIWTPNGIQTQYVERKESTQPSNPPGYARPKSASMGRSKSQGKYSSGTHDEIPIEKPVPTPVLNRQVLLTGPQGSNPNSYRSSGAAG